MDIKKLNEFKKLLDDGTITEEEFLKLKKSYIEKYKSFIEGESISGPTTVKPSEITHSKTPGAEKFRHLAGTTDFWGEFHKSLKLSYSGWNNFKHLSLDEWIAACWDSDEMHTYLKVLFNYPLIKGEFLLTFNSGFLLTNYRLIINDENTGCPSIPLNSIKSYFNNNDGIIEYEFNGKRTQLQYQTWLHANSVNPAINRNQGGSLSDDEKYFLSKSRLDISKEFAGLTLPELTMMPRPSNVKVNKGNNSVNEETSGLRAVVVALIIGIIGLIVAFNVRSVSGFMFTFITLGCGFLGFIAYKLLSWLSGLFNVGSHKLNSGLAILIIYIVGFMGYSGALSYTKSSERSDRERQESKSSSTGSSHSSGSSSSYSSGKKCSYCGSSFSGNGYNYVGGECGSGSSSYYSKCSMKCCSEARNNDRNLKKNYNLRNF